MIQCVKKSYCWLSSFIILIIEAVCMPWFHDCLAYFFDVCDMVGFEILVNQLLGYFFKVSLLNVMAFEDNYTYTIKPRG